MRSPIAALLVVMALLPVVESSAQGQSLSACQAMTRRPVLFVHGSGLGPDTWNSMISTFQRGGYPARHLHAIRLIPNDGSNVKAAERFVAPAVRNLLAAARRDAEAARCPPPSKVDIVAHSMGSVSARWYVAQVDSTRVRNLVGLAPANHGTNALCGLPGDGNAELCPAFSEMERLSPVQTTLNGTSSRPVDETPHGLGRDSLDRPAIKPTASSGVYYWTIRIEPDEWILPASSALLDGAGGRTVPFLPPGASESSPGNILWPSRTSHDDLPRDPEVILFVFRLLAEHP